MALGHTKSVEIGALMWLDGLKGVKMGSQWAQFTRFCTRNGPISFLEKGVSDPSLTHGWSQNGLAAP